jgi:hypothetical protein
MKKDIDIEKSKQAVTIKKTLSKFGKFFGTSFQSILEDKE